MTDMPYYLQTPVGDLDNIKCAVVQLAGIGPVIEVGIAMKSSSLFFMPPGDIHLKRSTWQVGCGVPTGRWISTVTNKPMRDGPLSPEMGTRTDPIQIEVQSNSVYWQGPPNTQFPPGQPLFLLSLYHYEGSARANVSFWVDAGQHPGHFRGIGPDPADPKGHVLVVSL